MYAPGIPRKDFLGNDSKIKSKQILDYIVQRHAAVRRGLHYDLRIGNKQLGMYSWALGTPPPKLEGDKIPAHRTNLHSSKYNDFEGEIPKGMYGHGMVSQHDKGKVLITRRTPNTISFARVDKRHPERFTLVKPGNQYGKNYWILVKQHTPDEAGAEKLHYKAVHKDDITDILKKLPEGATVQPKIDGALQFLNVGKHKTEMLSHRISKTTGKPVLHTERFFGEVPHMDIPKELRNSVFQAEVYAHKDGKPLRSQETSGILNSSIEKALNTKKDRGVELRAMLFNVSKIHGKDIDVNTPYAERKKLLEDVLKILPKDKFHLPEEATNSKDALKLWDKIKTDKDEGIVIHPAKGKPMKAKLMTEQDVYIRGYLPAEKGSKYDGNAIGSINYSHTKTGPTVGYVSSGIDDNLRKLMYKNPKDFIGRIIKVHSMGQESSGALRNPVFLNLHEDY